MHGVVGGLRVGHVALDPAYGQAAAQASAPADFDHVAQLAVAGGLADEAPIDPLAARLQHLDDAAGTVDGGPLLVARDQKGDRTAVVRMRSHEFLDGRHHRRETALHVGRAAAVKEAVHDHRRERVGPPFLERSRRHDVGMAGEAEYRCAVAARRPEILDGSERQRLDAKADRREPRDHQRLTAAVSGTHRRPRDQFLGQLERRRHPRIARSGLVGGYSPRLRRSRGRRPKSAPMRASRGRGSANRSWRTRRSPTAPSSTPSSAAEPAA